MSLISCSVARASSLGHARCIGVTTAFGASTTYHAGFWTCVAGGILAGLLLSAALGLLVSHVRDVYFLMITLALGMVLWGVSYRWIPVTGGDNGISGIPRLEAHAGLPFSGAVPFYYIALLVFVACAGMMALVVRSPFGLTLKGIRENEPRMKSLGFNTWLHCYLSYVIAGAFASVAGIVWAYYNGFVSPTYLDLTASSELFLMVTLGGPGTLIGPALGAAALVVLKNVISAYTQRPYPGIVYAVTIRRAGTLNLAVRRKPPWTQPGRQSVSSLVTLPRPSRDRFAGFDDEAARTRRLMRLCVVHLAVRDEERLSAVGDWRRPPEDDRFEDEPISPRCVCRRLFRPAEFRDGCHGLVSGHRQLRLLENRALEARLLRAETGGDGDEPERRENCGRCFHVILLGIVRVIVTSFRRASVAESAAP